MKTISEIDVMKIIDDNLSKILDPETKNRILKWACEKFSSKPIIFREDEEKQEPSQNKIKSKKVKAKRNPVKKSSKKGSLTLSIVKTLNLRPSGKKSLSDFVKEKSPDSNEKKCLVATYYLKNTLKQQVGLNCIYTCFKSENWRIPANLKMTLLVLSSRRGWLDTSDSNDIKVTTHGENFIEHDMTEKKTEKKKVKK